MRYGTMKKLAPFAEQLVSQYGYKFNVSVRKIADSLGSVSFVTVAKYLALLEQYGYLTKSIPNKRRGAIYELNKRRVNMLIRDTKAIQEIMSIGL